MKKSKDILFVGPISPPVTGQSIAFSTLLHELKISNKDIINTNIDTRYSIFKAMIYILNIFKIIFFLLSRNYDVVYFTCSRSFMGSIKDVILINVCSLLGVKLINHLHGSDFYDFVRSSSFFYRKILIKSYHKVHTSIVLLDVMVEQFRDFPSMNIEVVTNFYDSEIDDKFNKNNQDRFENIRLIYLSNIIATKGIFELMEAFNIICQKFDNVDLFIAGEFMSDEKMSADEVEKKFDILLESNVRIKYLRGVYGEDKIELLLNSDIFVLPSYYKSEAFPISIIEAMATKNAIVTSNYRYLPYIVNSSNGALVIPGSSQKLAEALEELIVDRDKLESIQVFNRYHARNHYSLHNYINKLSKIILS
ncbi:glycosyltransferase family 4 protein [Vibrio sp. Of14-4]|uniref:glycosyltransferase family 4 protein n=1 Tax=Vibrio sp. Of14-4 TaxID=2724878 RepID=UPI001EF2775A|nr:glycosyltransferase family 4 protein [Vibrio sp. Of14-4]MCG7489667.1 glycosyltransferase family 4 protein [Vibrio sp. Of14-4]